MEPLNYSELHSLVEKMVYMRLEQFYVYLSNRFDVLKDNKDCLAEFLHKSPCAEKKPVKKEAKKDERKCEYVKTTGKSKGDVCGKTAKNEHKGKWYCGVVKSDGTSTACIKIIKGKEKLASPAMTSLAISSVFNNKIALEKVGEFNITKLHRIVVNKEKHEALGILNKDNKTLSKLNNEQIKYAESKGLIVRDNDEDQDADDENEVESREEEEESSIVETESDDEV
jgi:hypothetical protein